MKNTIKNYLLNNMEVTVDVVRELNNWNGCLEHLNVLDMELLDDCLHDCDATEIANKIFYGNFNPNHDYFRFNAYDNLESLSVYDLEDEYKSYIDEIVEELLYHMNAIDIYDDELNELLEQYEECEAEEE